MNASIARPARRLVVTLAAAGLAALGSVAVAPAASAEEAKDGVSYIIDGPGNGNGPDRFIVTREGRVPVFFCDPEKPNKRKDICIADPTAPGGTRF